MDSNSTDHPKTIVVGRAATPLIAAPISLFSIHYKNEDLIYFYCLFFSLRTQRNLNYLLQANHLLQTHSHFEWIKMFSNSSRSRRTNYSWRKKPIKKRTKRRRQQQEAESQSSTETVPQVYPQMCMCLPKEVSKPGIKCLIKDRRKPKIHNDTIIPQEYITCFTYISIFFDTGCIQGQDNCLN